MPLHVVRIFSTETRARARARVDDDYDFVPANGGGGSSPARRRRRDVRQRRTRLLRRRVVLVRGVPRPVFERARRRRDIRRRRDVVRVRRRRVPPPHWFQYDPVRAVHPVPRGLCPAGVYVRAPSVSIPTRLDTSRLRLTRPRTPPAPTSLRAGNYPQTIAWTRAAPHARRALPDRRTPREIRSREARRRVMLPTAPWTSTWTRETCVMRGVRSRIDERRGRFGPGKRDDV